MGSVYIERKKSISLEDDLTVLFVVQSMKYKYTASLIIIAA